MSWWIVDFKSINEDGTEGLCEIECDTASSLPTADQTLTAGISIVRGSKAQDLSTGDRYKMDSSGSWVRQPSRMQIDLTGYATTQDLTDGLATKASLNDIYGIKNQLPNGTDLNDLTAGCMMCPGATVAATLINSPTTTEAFIIYTDYLATTSRAIQRIYSFTTTTGIPCQYMRARWSQGWTPWYKVMMQ